MEQNWYMTWYRLKLGKDPNKVFCLGAFTDWVTWPLEWPDDTITGVTDVRKVKTDETNLNYVKMSRLLENKVSLEMAEKIS